MLLNYVHDGRDHRFVLGSVNNLAVLVPPCSLFEPIIISMRLDIIKSFIFILSIFSIYMDCIYFGNRILSGEFKISLMKIELFVMYYDGDMTNERLAE